MLRANLPPVSKAEDEHDSIWVYDWYKLAHSNSDDLPKLLFKKRVANNECELTTINSSFDRISPNFSKPNN